MISLQTVTLKRLLLLSLWLDYLWEQYLCARQYKKSQVMVDQPTVLKSTMTKKFYDKARTSMLNRKRFGFVKDLFSVATSTVIILYDVVPMTWSYACSFEYLDEILQNCVWYITFTTLLAAIHLPFTIYDVFVIESDRWHEFLALKKLKTFIWSQVFMTVICSFVVLVIQQGDEVFIGVWMVFCTMILVVGTTYPFMAPSGYRQLTTLSQGELRTEIFNLASDLSFPVKQIYVEEDFKRTFCQHIYFYGTSKEKNVVLADQLLSNEEDVGYNNQQILALFLFEFSHWYHNQAFKYVAALELNLALYFGAFYLLFRSPQIYESFGFVEARPTLVGVYMVLKYALRFYSTILGFFFLKLSRGFVLQNDRFVVSMGKGEDLVGAIVRLEKNNNEFPVFDNLYSAWHHDKPPLLQRVANIRDHVNLKFD